MKNILKFQCEKCNSNKFLLKLTTDSQLVVVCGECGDYTHIDEVDNISFESYEA